MMQRAAIGLFLILAVGCATTDDPRQGGLFSYNPAAYKARLEQRQQTRSALEQNQQQQEEQKGQLESDVQTERARQESAQARLDALEDSLVQLQQNINQYHDDTNAKHADQQYRKQKSKLLQNKIAALKKKRQNEQLTEAEMKKESESIKREIDELAKFGSQQTQ